MEARTETGKRPFSRENTEGYSDEELETVNRMYARRIARYIDADRAINESLIQYIREQVLIDHDIGLPHIPRVITTKTEQLKISKINDIRMRLVPQYTEDDQLEEYLKILALVDLENGDLPGVLLVIYPNGEVITQRDLQSPIDEIPDDLNEINWPQGVLVCEDGFPRWLPGWR